MLIQTKKILSYKTHFFYISKQLLPVMKTYDHIINTIEKKGAAYLVLLDPDNLSQGKAVDFLKHCEKAGVDGFLIGGSLMMSGNFEALIAKVKMNTSLPAIIFL